MMCVEDFVSRLFWCLFTVCCLPDDICTAMLGIVPVLDLDTKLKLLREQNLDKWVSFRVLCCISILSGHIADWWTFQTAMCGYHIGYITAGTVRRALI